MACRLGLEFLQVVEDEDLLARVTDTGSYLLDRLRDLASDSDVAVEARGRGLLVGMELNQPARPVVEAALEQGVMLNMVQGNVLRFLPSFLLERKHVDVAIDILCGLLPTRAKSQAAASEALVPATV